MWRHLVCKPNPTIIPLHYVEISTTINQHLKKNLGMWKHLQDIFHKNPNKMFFHVNTSYVFPTTVLNPTEIVWQHLYIFVSKYTSHLNHFPLMGVILTSVWWRSAECFCGTAECCFSPQAWRATRRGLFLSADFPPGRQQSLRSIKQKKRPKSSEGILLQSFDLLADVCGVFIHRNVVYKISIIFI